MGAVYRGEHLLLRKGVAVKMLLPELGLVDEAVRRFEREAQSVSKLDHPNIIRVFDFGRSDEGVLYLVMELLAGESLTAEIARGPIAPGRATRLLASVLRALEHAHSEGVIHRDLKPDNVFLQHHDRGEVVKLLDFGIARVAAPTDGQAPLTRTGMIFGTPEYISPEQVAGEVADARADLYAAGVMLFEMLTGRRPFEAESRVALMAAHLTQRAPSLETLLPGVAPALSTVVARALEKQRELRFPSANTFREALERAARGRPARPWERASSMTRRAAERCASMGKRLVDVAVARAGRNGFRWPRALVGGIALLLLLVAGALGLALRHPSPPRPEPPPAAATHDLLRAEAMLREGDLPSARAALQQELSEHPEVARVHYLLGNLYFAEGERERSLSEYREATRLDSGYYGDPALLDNLRTLLDGQTSAAALALLADAGTPALPRLIDCAKECRDPRVRRAASASALKLGAPHDTAAELEFGQLTDTLEHGRTCKERGEAVAGLRALGDPRAIEPLRHARDRRGGFLGLERTNGCIARAIADALRALDHGDGHGDGHGGSGDGVKPTHKK